MENGKTTPMIKQYFEIKKDYPDSILFFRMGDFYEMFFDDAKTAAPILEIVLTSRDKKKENSIPLCGIPYHAKEHYASKLLKKGYKVAICEQIEDPALAKGIVKRDVVQILTPATALEIDLLNDDINNYVVSIFKDEKAISIASVDLSVSSFEVKSFDLSNPDSFYNEFYKKNPQEVVISEEFEKEFGKILERFPEFSDILINKYEPVEFNYYESEDLLKKHFKIESIEGLGLVGYNSAVISAGVLLKYLRSVRRSILNNISTLHFTPREDYLILDQVSFKNLEILKNLQTGTSKGSLFNAIDMTVTPMGKRLLKHWLSYPLTNKSEIEKRLDGVEEFSKNLIVRTEIRKLLKQMGDLAKLNTKISLNIALPLHLLTLKETLIKIPEIKKDSESLVSPVLKKTVSDLHPLNNIVKLIDISIAEDPSNNLSTGNFIRDGYNKELDELRSISRNAKEIISAMEKEEKKNTKIPSLKIKYNKVFGYFIDVTKTHLKLIPDHYIRKQTLVNSERFITDELKKLEEKILKAEEKIIQIEKDLFNSINEEIRKNTKELNNNSNLCAFLDALAAGGELAMGRNYCRPVITDNHEIDIKDGRHPVIETRANPNFIPNDTKINSSSFQILIITGPNMGGKSTYLRQNALIVILAQAGYFIPADSGTIGICDRIFTRIGASDSLIEGKSTFLIEMIETSIILNNITGKSLILLDEIGRGTSTYDGLSIAWSVIEYLHSLKERPKTLFATHYHELTELSEILDRLKNFHITVREWEDNVVFLHKIVPGATDQSFGIHVAKIAGIPDTVIERSKDILLDLEKKELNRLVKERITGNIKKIPKKQKTLFPDDKELKVWDEIRDKLKEIDITNITPLESMNILHYLKHKSENFK
ncbi:MAG: DNA mismatch repair protein MutS [Acidobacteriota bacterium]